MWQTRPSLLLRKLAVRCVRAWHRALSTTARLKPDAGRVQQLHEWHEEQQSLPIAKRDIIVGSQRMAQQWHPPLHDTHGRQALERVQAALYEECVHSTVGGDMSSTLLAALDAVRSQLEASGDGSSCGNGHDKMLEFPSFSMFHGDDSPSRPLTRKVIEQLFCKAREAKEPAMYNDHSGFAIAAHCGVGKSTLLRMLTCASIAMFNVNTLWPCYINLASGQAHNLEMVDLLEFLCQHYEAQLPASSAAAAATTTTTTTTTPPRQPQRSPHARMEHLRVAPALFLDELEVAYTWDNECWGSVADFAAYAGTACFAASSSSRLPALVEKRDIQRLLELYPAATVARRQPLNSDKLKMLPLADLHSQAQYKAFLVRRLGAAAAADATLIQQLHMLTGGNVGLLGHQLARLRSGLSLDTGVLNCDLDLEHQLELAALLQALASGSSQGDWVTPHLTVDEACALIKQAKPSAAAYAVLDRLTQEPGGQLQQVVAEHGTPTITVRYPGRLNAAWHTDHHRSLPWPAQRSG